MSSQFKLTSTCIRAYEIISLSSILVSDDMVEFIKERTVNGSVPQAVCQYPLLCRGDRSPVSQDKYQSLMATEWERADLLPIRLAKYDLEPCKYVIIDGRHRYMAYALAGFEEVPVFT